MKTYIFRLQPGCDLKQNIEQIVNDNKIEAGFIITCVGGLTQAVVRMAGASPTVQDIRTYNGHFEITSLVGTISVNGTHLHMSFSNLDGKVVGGHLKEGSIVGPTAEVVLGIEELVIMKRELDNNTGFDELVIK